MKLARQRCVKQTSLLDQFRQPESKINPKLCSCHGNSQFEQLAGLVQSYSYGAQSFGFGNDRMHFIIVHKLSHLFGFFLCVSQHMCAPAYLVGM